MTASSEIAATGIPPAYASPAKPPSLLSLLRHAMSDPASVIPAAIYHEWALKLPAPGAPVVVAHPDDVRRVLLDKGDVFGRNRQLQMMMRRAWGQGLAAAEGERWAVQRRAAAPAFRPHAVNDAKVTMAAVAQAAADTWPEGPIELTGAIGRIVIEILLETLLIGLADVDVDALARDIPVFVREVTAFGSLDMMPLSDAMIDRLRGFGSSAEAARLRDFAGRLAAAGADPPDLRQDIPALMRGAGPLADNILGFLPAGFETSALAAAWAVYALALHPEWQDAVRAEAMTAEGTSALPIATQVAQEVLRLYPPGPLLVRAAMTQTEIGGFRLKKGQVVIVPVFAIHRHRQLWTQPDAFDPARFAPGASYDRGAFLPFGMGPRLCLAAQFALTEMTVVISALVKAFNFTPGEPAAVVSLKTTTHSATGLNVVARRYA